MLQFTITSIGQGIVASSSSSCKRIAHSPPVYIISHSLSIVCSILHLELESRYLLLSHSSLLLRYLVSNAPRTLYPGPRAAGCHLPPHHYNLLGVQHTLPYLNIRTLSVVSTASGCKRFLLEVVVAVVCLDFGSKRARVD